MGFGPTFRFGNPFFLQPNVDELIWRTQIKDNVSIVIGKHTFKVGGEWMHTLNDQVFRGFFTGRYIFDSVTGFLRYASPAAAGGFGPEHGRLLERHVRDRTRPRARRDDDRRRPAAALPAGRGPDGSGHRRGRRVATSPTTSSRCSCRTQWQVRPNLTLNYGLRWDAQLMPETVDPTTTAYARVSRTIRRSRPTARFPSQWSMFQPRFGVAWDVTGNGKSVVRAQRGRLLRAAEHAEPGRLGDDQRPAAADDLREHCEPAGVRRADADLAERRDARRRCRTEQFPLFSGVRVFDRDYKNPHIYAFNVAYEQELAPDWAGYVDFTWTEGTRPDALPQLQPERPGVLRPGPGTGNTYAYTGNPWGPQLDEVMVTNSRGESRYRGADARPAQALLARVSSSKATTCCPRTRTTTRTSAIRSPTAASTSSISSKDWGPSDRDIRHKVNFFGYFVMPHGVLRPTRACSTAARSRSPPTRAVLNGDDRGRNGERKDNEFFSFDWRLSRPFRFGGRYELIADPRDVQHVQQRQQHQPADARRRCSTSTGFLRTGVGDPRQVQLAVKMTF